MLQPRAMVFGLLVCFAVRLNANAMIDPMTLQMLLYMYVLHSSAEDET